MVTVNDVVSVVSSKGSHCFKVEYLSNQTKNVAAANRKAGITVTKRSVMTVQAVEHYADKASTIAQGGMVEGYVDYAEIYIPESEMSKPEGKRRNYGLRTNKKTGKLYLEVDPSFNKNGKVEWFINGKPATEEEAKALFIESARNPKPSNKKKIPRLALEDIVSIA